MEPTFTHFRTAARIIAGGWVQNCWYDDDGNPCLLRALGEAIGYNLPSQTLPKSFLLELDSTLMRTSTYCRSSKQQEERRRALKKGGMALQRVIYGWNDTPGRTQAEVIAVLTVTAERLEGKHRVWLRGVIARAIRPTASWRHFDERELELDLEEAVA